MSAAPATRVGIDVGGTFTDGVAVRDGSIVAKEKAPTTEDVTAGIVGVLDELLEAGVDSGAVEMVSLATTHTTNAIIERRGLDRVGVLRLARPTGTTIPPLTGWPRDLREALGGEGNVAMLHGGYELDGSPVSPLDEAEVREAVGAMSDSVDAVAVTGVFSPVRPDQEERVAGIVAEVLGDGVPVTRSAEIASISLLERENSAILNAAVSSVMRRAIDAVRRALEDRAVDARLFIVQNDGSVMDADYAERYPIFTVASGPAASIRGAVFLSGIEDGVVVDVGGTSTDVGYVVDGFPRESTMTVTIGGVKTNVRAPDLTSVALGGGTVVKSGPDGFEGLGPESVGYDLQRLARAYGGPMTTVHDLAVRTGRLAADLDIFDTPHVTDPDRVAGVDERVVEAAWRAVGARIERTIDEMKTDPEPVPAVVVGGGATVVPESFAGTAGTHNPEGFEVAGAVGATLAEVAAYAEDVIDLEVRDRQDGIDGTIERATDNAVRNGAVRETVEVLDVEEIPFTYMPGEREKIRVRVKGVYGGVR